MDSCSIYVIMNKNMNASFSFCSHFSLFPFATLKCAVLSGGRGEGSYGSQTSVSGSTTIYLLQCNTSVSHRVDCGLWNIGSLLFNDSAKLLDIGRNWNTLSHTPIQRFALTRAKTLILSMPIARSLKTFLFQPVKNGSEKKSVVCVYFCSVQYSLFL